MDGRNRWFSYEKTTPFSSGIFRHVWLPKGTLQRNHRLGLKLEVTVAQLLYHLAAALSGQKGGGRCLQFLRTRPHSTHRQISPLSLASTRRYPDGRPRPQPPPRSLGAPAPLKLQLASYIPLSTAVFWIEDLYGPDWNNQSQKKNQAFKHSHRSCILIPITFHIHPYIPYWIEMITLAPHI